MRSLSIAALVSLAACAAAPPRALPQAAWPRGSAISLVFTDATQTDENKANLKSDLEQDLLAAGFRIESAPPGAGGLALHVDVHGGYSTTTASLYQDGQQFDRFEFDAISLPCIAITDGAGSLRCWAREVVARVVESKPLAAALAQGRPAPAASAARAPGALSGKLAVLELRNFAKDLTHENAQYFTDMLRSSALKAQPALEIITRENLVVLLEASGKKLDECEGQCEVETGRRIGADLIISGEIQKLGSLYKISLRLHDTHEGRLLASTLASGKSIEELDASAQAAAEQLVTLR